MTARAVLLLLAAGACSRAEPTPSVAVPAAPPADATPALDAAPDAADVRVCTYRPPAWPAPRACPPPGPAIVARAKQLVARVSIEDEDYAPVVTFGCEQASGWLVDVDGFQPKPSFHDGLPCSTSIAADECDTVSAMWKLPTSGPPRLIRGERLGSPLDVDGDGALESITGGATGSIVWFDAGRKPVRLPGARVWVVLGDQPLLTSLDGEYPQGFFIPDSHAYAVSRAGVVERADLLPALWATTVAAHCPRAQVIATRREPAVPTAAPTAACASIGADRKARLEAEITAATVERLRQRGTMMAEGPPVFAWGCDQPGVAALVTYCEGDGPDACADERGAWWFEVWSHGAAGIHRLHRSSSASVLHEWAWNARAELVTSADLDGDGALDPIVQTTSAEGGSADQTFELAAIVRDRFVPITRITASKGQAFVGPLVAALPRSKRAVLAFAAPIGRVGVQDPLAWETAPPAVWQLDGKAFRQLRGDPVREVVKATAAARAALRSRR